ncbi:lytic murein transglycosylase B [Alteromonadaceae bacterium BrNp21-10]|nr:lytic murein transglycosylase B [Alteromonadaceae bacterium BrNp21-10]
MLRPLLLGLLLTCSFSLALAAPPFTKEQQAFVDDLVNNHQFDETYIKDVLGKANKSQSILESIARPWEAKPWHQYYPIFLTEKRLQKGLEFWQKHQQTLARAEQTFGVPAEIIVAIIGVETFYGTYKGKYNVLDSLYTLGFYYPPRSKFFKSELKEMFLLSREEKFDPTELMGSYAGAMGWGQFISSSYRHYAVDFDNDGIRDLLNNAEDAIGSVANYFKQHGWQANQPVAFKAQVEDPKANNLITKGLKFTQNWQQIQALGVSIEGEVAGKVGSNVDGNAKAKLFAFELEQGQEYWVGFNNFYSITRYNHSPLYAMAVYQFSQQLKQQRN